MKKKYQVTTILILISFLFCVFLTLRFFTYLKTNKMNDYLLKYFYCKELNKEEELNDIYMYLDEKCNDTFVIWGSWLLGSKVNPNDAPTKERIKELLPKVQRDMFLSYHNGEYLYTGNMGILDDDESDAANIAMVAWRNVIRANKKISIAVYLISLIIMIGIICIRRMLYRDKVSEDRMVNTLSKGLAYELAEPRRELREALEQWKNATEAERDVYAGNVITQVDQMDEVIKNLLRLVDFESGNLVLNCEEVNLEALTKKVLKLLDPMLRKRGQFVSLTSPNPQDFVVMADPSIMKIILGNLIMNASDYSSGSIKINFNVGDTVRIQFVSNGHQIDEDATTHVWTECSYDDECKADEIGSNGVGLAIVAQMLEAQKAEYGCEAIRNGTTFWIEMKRIKSNHE